MTFFKYFSDSKVLKSDFHGAEIEVIGSRCFGLVGLKGVIIKESFSTFTVCDIHNPSKIKSNLSLSAIFCLFLSLL